jgi:GT2 family glycosyltransferase/nucleoside-diphosphate-sugar epimerase
MTTLLVTGANGFVGQALCREALAQGLRVRGATRTARDLDGVENIVVGAVDGFTDWKAALSGIDVVVHLAARVHVMRDTSADPLTEFLKSNLHGTINLAVQAADAGVKRLVYVSSIKVNGEQTGQNQPFSATDEADPHDPYAVSKWQAEQALQQIAEERGMEIVIVRPPLIYGPGVKGNFLRLLQAVDKGIPLPLANAHNARSLLYLGNMVDALLLCATHPAAAGKTYLLRDGEDISMPVLVRRLGEGMGKKAKLFSLPIGLLRRLAKTAGQQGAFDRVTGSLCIDDAPIRRELGWQPRFTLGHGLLVTAAWYKQQHHPSTEPVLPKLKHGAAPSYRVSVVIVNYNAGDILQACVGEAVLQAEQVIVVDNASADDSIAALRKLFPAVTIIANEHNLGFAKACNQGALAASGEHIFFLNPDCILEPGAVQRLVFAAHSAPDVGMVGGLLTNPDGSEQGGSRRTVPTPWRSLVRVTGLGGLSGRYPRLFSDFDLNKLPMPEKPVEMEAISGACMLARRDALEQVGLLDEAYFMHCEDLDWCMRFRRNGWKLLFVPDARMVHYKGHCSKSRPIFVEWNKHKGMLRFYNKFFRHQYPGLLMGLVTLGVWGRFVAVAVYHFLSRMKRSLGRARG